MQNRRIVTGNNNEGKSCIVINDVNANQKSYANIGIVSTQVWGTFEFPITNIDYKTDQAINLFDIAPCNNGSIFRVVQFLPTNRRVLMHKTNSIDYAIVIEGSISLQLDAEEILLNSGDCVVQQGTSHAWINKTKALCKVAFVLLDRKIG